MKRPNLRVLTLTPILFCLMPGVAVAESEAPTPLKEAVASCNERISKRLAGRLEAWKGDPRTAPLTEDEVIAAIRNWDREAKKVADKTYRIYEAIADSRTLPPRATLRPFSQWFYREGDNEELVWRIELDVRTGEKSGYNFLIRKETLDQRRALRPAPNLRWIVNPYDLSLDAVFSTRGARWTWGGIIFLVEEDKEGALIVTLAWKQTQFARPPRFVAFDAELNRYPLTGCTLAGHDDMRMARVRLDPSQLPARKVQHLGIEGLEAWAVKELSQVAVWQAKEKGIEILPLPQVGRPYKFVLTTTDGQVIDSQRLQNKVLLIDCWATWCGACMSKMPKLKEIYEKWHTKGLEVVGLSFDQDAKAAEAAFESHKIPWPMILVPGDTETRQLWSDAARIDTLPRVLLIDQRGILCSYFRSSEEIEEGCEEKIASLLQGSSAAADDPARQ